jgi:hypothetical protein
MNKPWKGVSVGREHKGEQGRIECPDITIKCFCVHNSTPWGDFVVVKMVVSRTLCDRVVDRRKCAYAFLSCRLRTVTVPSFFLLPLVDIISGGRERGGGKEVNRDDIDPALPISFSPSSSRGTALRHFSQVS